MSRPEMGMQFYQNRL